MIKTFFLPLFFCLLVYSVAGQNNYTLLKPDRVFDGQEMHTGWVVLVQGKKITQAGPMMFKLPADTKIIELKGCTLLPGLIEGHSHMFLHPYNEAAWDDQVLKESRAERSIRAAEHARATLNAGFTTSRDLGTEGAMYDDVGLKSAINKKVIPGPRLIVATRAIVARGTYGPKSSNPDVVLPQGAAEVSGATELAEEVRTEIGKGADLIKIYADYRFGPNGEILPAFSAEEIKVAADIAHQSGRMLVAHATNPQGMMNAINGGVNTIEHGDHGTAEVFKLMKEKKVALCPTLAAGEFYEQYRGWKKGTDPLPQRITEKRKSFQLALDAGVTICMGGDVGVFTHGNNAIEMELMVEYGMNATDVLRSATSVNARVFGVGDKLGNIKKDWVADIIAVTGDPSQKISDIRNIRLVMKEGEIIVNK